MARKFLLVAVTVWFGRDSNYQIYVGTWVLLFAVLLQVACQPYEDKLMGRLETVSLCSVLGTLLLGNAIALGGLAPASEDAVRALVALLNAGTLAFFAHCFVRSVREVDSGMKQQVEMRTVRASVVANPVADGENPGAPGAAQQRASIL